MEKVCLASIKNGIVCFTFDDRNFEGWINALPLFEKYNAHASFFLSGEMDDATIEVIQLLQKSGHTVGLHTAHHKDAPEYFEAHGKEAYLSNEIMPQLEKLKQSGIEVRSLAYPNNRRNSETDSYLSRCFDRFRAGRTDAADNSELFVPIDRLKDNITMHGFGIGEYYSTVEAELMGKIERAAETNTCVTFFSHNIAENATHINMPTALLEKCLQKAQELNVKVLGFDEL